MFVSVDNDLLAALPLASPRLKILKAPHWCCRVTPRAGYFGQKCKGCLGDVLNEDLGPKRRLVPGLPIPEA